MTERHHQIGHEALTPTRHELIVEWVGDRHLRMEWRESQGRRRVDLVVLAGRNDLQLSGVDHLLGRGLHDLENAIADGILLALALEKKKSDIKSHGTVDITVIRTSPKG